MTRRQDKSKGQAIVLVTLSLIAMAGMIGLAVDLGWSFFVQRSAQAAADAAAFGAVQEAKTRLKGGWNGFACPAASKSTDVFCQPAAVDCSGIPGGPTNLYNGCRYAVTNGFTSGSARQKVTIQSNCGVPASGPACTLPPALGVTNAAYWVTVKTVQTVPQLFSSILGNTTGIVSAVSTAALVSTPLPGQIIALNRPGDPSFGGGACPGSDSCGVNFDLSDVNITAPAGIVMSSTCNGAGGQAGCGSANWAGRTDEGAKVVASPGTVQVLSSGGETGAVNDTTAWTPAPTPSSGRVFQDPTQGEAQPPLAASSAVKSCAILNGNIYGASGRGDDGGGTVTLGPFNYYSYSNINPRTGQPQPDGRSITIRSGTVNFSASGACTSGISGSSTGPSVTGASQSSSSFPMYAFFGGLRIGSGSGGDGGDGGPRVNVTLGPGQYVMAGSLHDRSGNATPVLSITGTNPVVQSGDSSGNPVTSGSGYAGNLIITTDPTYPGLSAQESMPGVSGAVALGLKQGPVNFQAASTGGGDDEDGGAGGSVKLYGVNTTSCGLACSSLTPFTNLLMWQDRSNSTVTYDGAGNVVSTTNPGLAAENSPGMNLLGLNAELNGVVYQPRGAWVTTDVTGANNEGNCGTLSGALQLITGAFQANCEEPRGTVNLKAPLPLLIYVNALIQ